MNNYIETQCSGYVQILVTKRENNAILVDTTTCGLNLFNIFLQDLLSSKELHTVTNS